MMRPPGVTIAPVQYLEPMGSEKKLAYRQYISPTPASCGLLYCEGLKSDMEGIKGSALEIESQMRLKCNCVRFDYQGQGLSSGDFDSTSVCQWVGDTFDIIDNVCTREPQIVIASSIGAWIALHVALQRPQRIKALVLIAPAVDITDFWWRRMSADEKQRAYETKRVQLNSEYLGPGESLPLSFYEVGKQLLLMGGPPRSIGVQCPIRVFHGLRDTVVPPSMSRQLMEKLQTDDVHITLIKDGDHRLSRPQDLSAIYSAVQEMLDY